MASSSDEDDDNGILFQRGPTTSKRPLPPPPPPPVGTWNDDAISQYWQACMDALDQDAPQVAPLLNDFAGWMPQELKDEGEEEDDDDVEKEGEQANEQGDVQAAQPAEDSTTAQQDVQDSAC